MQTSQGFGQHVRSAQRTAVANHLNGGHGKLVAEFTECESGKQDDRPAFALALAACRQHKATLIVAKLDRLSRNLFAADEVKKFITKRALSRSTLGRQERRRRNFAISRSRNTCPQRRSARNLISHALD